MYYHTCIDKKATHSLLWLASEYFLNTLYIVTHVTGGFKHSSVAPNMSRRLFFVFFSLFGFLRDSQHTTKPDRDCECRGLHCLVSGGWPGLSGMDFLGSLCSTGCLMWAVRSRRSTEVTMTHLGLYMDHAAHQSPLTTA